MITATNRNLTEMIAAGQFLEDLFYRPCELLEQRFVPPLRLPEAAAKEVPQVMARDVPGQEHRKDMIPE